MRRGNMGHLTRIANAVVRNLERGAMQTPVSEVIQGEPRPGLAAMLHPSAGGSCLETRTVGCLASQGFSLTGCGPWCHSVGQASAHAQGTPRSPAVLSQAAPPRPGLTSALACPLGCFLHREAKPGSFLAACALTLPLHVLAPSAAPGS